ncbi:MAG: cation transporter [Deltaproteobacteria bacterium SG8_13]|nr:MAG: cation transporter [Deltaproteobacteria bacterium SG8_13]
MSSQEHEQRRRLITISFSFGVATLLLIVKFYAYWLTHSAAILSDALESIINVVASAFAMVSVIMAYKPPDESHPYGHGKIEFFSAGFEGALIIGAAVAIFYTGASHLIHPHPLPNLGLGLVLLVVTAVVNLVLGISLLRVGRRTDSLTLIADGKHVLTDVYTSAGVLIGLVVLRFTDWQRLDGAIACLVGINILVTGWGLVRQSYHGLMDAANPDILQQLARLLTDSRRDLWVDIHQLRAWKSGNHLHVDLHLVLPKELSLEEAHTEAKVLETLITKHFQERASALIHMDPCIDKDCPVCARYDCSIREKPPGEQHPWSLETLTAHKGTGPFVRSSAKKDYPPDGR